MTDPIATVVADADVLAADVLVGGAARDALDLARAHEWVAVVASDPLLADAEYLLAELASEDLAAAWRDRIEELVTLVEHPPGDHPGLASALAGDARHLLTFDEGLSSARANVSLQGRVALSIRPPDAFVTLFDPESMYAVAVGGAYPGPDADPRA